MACDHAIDYFHIQYTDGMHIETYKLSRGACGYINIQIPSKIKKRVKSFRKPQTFGLIYCTCNPRYHCGLERTDFFLPYLVPGEKQFSVELPAKIISADLTHQRGVTIHNFWHSPNRILMHFSLRPR